MTPRGGCNVSKALRRFFLCASLAVLSACGGGPPRKNPGIENLAFLSDSKTLLFVLCNTVRCDLITYAPSEQRFTRIVPDDDTLGFINASKGRAPTEILTMFSARHGDFTNYAQIATVDLATQTYRTIKTGPSHKYDATFSSNGQKIAYVQSHGQRTWANGDPRTSDFDIHVLDLTTGIDTKVTNFCFYNVSRPYFAPDNDDLIFSGAGPKCNYPIPNSPHKTYGYKKYAEQYGEDSIVRIGGEKTVLEPWIRSQAKDSGNPQVADTGAVLFKVRTDLIDGNQSQFNYDLFLKDQSGVRRMTQLNSVIAGMAIAPDGRTAAYVIGSRKNEAPSLWLMDLTTRIHTKVPLEQLPADIAQIASFRVTEKID